jgi:VanZ family protein
MKFRIFTIITILIMVVIFVHSAMPAEMSSIESSVFERFVASILGVAPESVTFAVRKCAHFTEYLVLGLFMMLAAANAKRRGVFFTGLITWIIGTAYAISDEVHQIFVPGRSCELRDMCIDAAGVLCGVLIIAGVRHRRALKCEGAGALVK